MALGDYNGRQAMWQDTRIINHGNLRDNFLATTEEFSTVNLNESKFLSVNGNSVIEMVLLSSKVKTKLMRHYIDTE